MSYNSYDTTYNSTKDMSIMENDKYLETPVITSLMKIFHEPSNEICKFMNITNDISPCSLQTATSRLLDYQTTISVFEASASDYLEPTTRLITICILVFCSNY